MTGPASPPPWRADSGMQLSLGEAARVLGDLVVQVHGAPTLTIERLSNDSRQLQPGDGFVALTGARDGHAFITDALLRGARWVLVSRWPLEMPAGTGALVVTDVDRALHALAAWWRSRFTIPVIGIGGGVGKTTTKEATAGLLTALQGVGTVLKTPANWNDLRGVSLTLLGLRAHHRCAVLEMGMDRPGEVAEIAALARPQIGVVISVAATHLEYFPDMASLVATERGLVDSLPTDGLALLNADDRLVRAMASFAPCPVRTFGSLPEVDLRGIRATSRGAEPLRFIARQGAHAVEVRTTLLGKHLVVNALAALAVAEATGWDLATAGEALADVAVPQRIQLRPGLHASTIIDDTYNASPASMLAALDYLTDWPREPGGRRLAVLGTMRELGPRSAHEHHRLGRRAASRCDHLWATGEECQSIADGARKAGISAITIIEDPEQALQHCATMLQPHDVVLVKASHAVGLDRYVELLVEV